MIRKTITIEIPERVAEVFAYGYMDAEKATPTVSRQSEAREVITDLIKDALAER